MFLEQALDLCPGARRVLLTAYADTNAAIDAVSAAPLTDWLESTVLRNERGFILAGDARAESTKRSRPPSEREPWP